MAAASGVAEKGFTLPGDFARTLFQASRESLENECRQLLDPFCNEVKGACEAAAKAGATRVKCTAAIRKDAGVEAVFYEELKAVFDKTGVHVMRDQETHVNDERVAVYGQITGRPNVYNADMVRAEMARHFHVEGHVPEVPRGVEYTFVWGTVGHDGILHETEPMQQTTAIKPARYDPYDCLDPIYPLANDAEGKK